MVKGIDATQVVRQVDSSLSQLTTAGQTLPIVPIAVNVSAVQLRQEGFCALVREVLRKTGLQAEKLELEVTESVLLSNVDVMHSVLQILKEMGVSLALDDFGTGFSSLSYLKQLRVNKLKIDRSFVRDLPQDRDNAVITTAIINMAKILDLAVVAEGVETEAQLRFLRETGCNTVQGYHTGRPGLAEQMEMLLTSSPQPPEIA
jgi:EAL domain-containing protein (putative c-di-GMP-specific phosphodiesterase class I)